MESLTVGGSCSVPVSPLVSEITAPADARGKLFSVTFTGIGCPPTTSGPLTPVREITGAGLRDTEPESVCPFRVAAMGTEVSVVTGAELRQRELRLIGGQQPADLHASRRRDDGAAG
mgnify:CR=1 FL=1